MGYLVSQRLLLHMKTSIWSTQQEMLREALRVLRLNAQLTQVQLAKSLNKPQSYVSKYESGERRLDLLEVMAICHACGVALERFSADLEKAFKGF
ncbi:MAG: helix-turn-helix transcriptional regulator [Halopseudomonas sp.]